MNQAETAALVERIIGTWPTGPRGRIWTEELSKLDNTDRARQTYDQLVTTDEHPPSIARFITTYRTITRRNTAPTPPPAPDYGQAISLDEAITRLEARAARGDTAAAQAVAGLRKYRPTLATITAQPTTDPDYEDPF